MLPNIAFTQDDQDLALAEGWGLFAVEVAAGTLLEVQRFDEAEVFADDDAARAFVQEHAEAGSDLHRRAFSLIGASADAESTDNWLGADEHIVAHASNQYGPADTGSGKQAHDLATQLPKGGVVLETIVRPDGNQWDVAHVSAGDGAAVSVTIGSRRTKTRQEVVDEATAKHAEWTKMVNENKERREACIAQLKEIARRNGYRTGAKLGTLMPNTGKTMRATVIVTDHGDGTFDVEGTFGNKRGTIRQWGAAGIEIAIERWAAYARSTARDGLHRRAEAHD